MIDIDSTGLQPPLRTPEFEALFHLVKLATVGEDVSRVLIYYVDSLDDSVLPWLALQFDVLGYKGWLLADTDVKRRQLIKNAVGLHLVAGTPASIVNSLATLGFSGIRIIENPALICDGLAVCDGTEFCNQRRWDRFILSFDEGIAVGLRDLVDNLVEVWKSARCHRFIPLKPLVCDGSVRANGSEVCDGFTDNVGDLSVYVVV